MQFPAGPTGFDTLPGPAWTMTSPSRVAAVGAAVVATMLLVLYVYRRRTYIVQWTVSWLALAASLLVLGESYANERTARVMLGLAQFLGVIASLLLVLSADSYRRRAPVPRAFLWIPLPLAIWFGLAPLVFGSRAVIVPGYLLSAAALVAGAVAYLALLRTAVLLGAGIVGVTLLLLAGSYGWIALSAASLAHHNELALGVITTNAIVYVFAALGMHLMVFEDMTYELRRTNRRLATTQQELRQLVITDALTGCYNRRFFDEVVRRELQRHRRYNVPLCLLFIDIDRFKAINDTFGHEAGDRVLRHVAHFLRRNIRGADYLFRWGGDEFLVLISCAYKEAVQKALQLKTAFDTAPEAALLPDGVGLSVGATEVPAETTDVLPLIREADERMYRDKKRA
jgi:diguanylate cyclase (GGDEF)-like protein